MSLRSINLNLLPVLQALLHERHVSRAAKRIGLSQPAASKALAQLRAALGDPLLVRDGGAMILTKRAEDLIQQVDRQCQTLEAIWRPTGFEPATARRTFIFSSVDYGPILLVPRTTALLAQRAPGISMTFLNPAAFTVDAWDGIDFVVAPRRVLAAHVDRGGGFLPLFRDEFVAVVAAGHRLAAMRAPTREDIDSEQHVAFGVADGVATEPQIKDMISGTSPANVIATVQQFGTLPILALLTGAVTIIPRRLAEVIGQFAPLRILDGRSRGGVELCLAWTQRMDADPGHRWFRELVAEAVSDDRFGCESQGTAK